jgi:hypothetical protein
MGPVGNKGKVIVTDIRGETTIIRVRVNYILRKYTEIIMFQCFLTKILYINDKMVSSPRCPEGGKARRTAYHGQILTSVNPLAYSSSIFSSLNGIDPNPFKQINLKSHASMKNLLWNMPLFHTK